MDALLSALRVRPCPRSINGAHAPILDPTQFHFHHPTPLVLPSSGRKPSMAVCTRDAHTSADGDSAVIRPLRFRHFLSSPHSKFSCFLSPCSSVPALCLHDHYCYCSPHLVLTLYYSHSIVQQFTQEQGTPNNPQTINSTTPPSTITTTPNTTTTTHNQQPTTSRRQESAPKVRGCGVRAAEVSGQKSTTRARRGTKQERW